VPIFVSAVGMIDIPSEAKILALIKEITNNPD